MICQKFARKFEVAPKNCNSFSPKSCGNCEAGNMENLNAKIDNMVLQRKANMSIFRFPIQSSAEIHPHQFFE
jgi:hypothetical protein